MSEHRPALEHIQAYADHLRLEEKSAATVEKYLRDVRAFAGWLDGQESGATPPPASMPCSPP